MFCWKLLLPLTFTILGTVHLTRCQEPEKTWSGPLVFMLQGRYNLVTKMTNLKRNFQNFTTLDNFVKVLEGFPKCIEQFQDAPWDVMESETTGFLEYVLPELQKEEFEMPKVHGLIKSDKLTNYYEHSMAKLVSNMKEWFEYFSESSVLLRWHLICPIIPSVYKLEREISITDICNSTQRCSSTQFPYGSSWIETDVTHACTSLNKCDLEKALPMMVGVYWHALNNFIVKRICFDPCNRTLNSTSKCRTSETYRRLAEETKLLIAYASALPTYFNDVWNVNFLQRAVDARAFSNLDIALSLIKEKERYFLPVIMMCYAIEFNKACPYADIYKEFQFIKKVQHYRMNPGLVKDLRLHSKVNHAIMVKLQADTLRHIELLGTIKQLDHNLRASVSGISSYFAGLANYDEGIANADVVFIQGELEKYETATKDVEEKLKEEIKTAMGLMEATALANLAGEAGLLAARIVENCNPLRVIFGGSEPGDIILQVGEVANAAKEVVKATTMTLFISLGELNTDSSKITEAFVGESSNKAQLTRLKSLVDKIRNNQTGDIGADADKFVEDYADYTPQTDRSHLAQNNALWSAFKEAICEILNGDVGILGSIPQAVAGGMLICEKLEGTLAQFFTLREDIFDFQFQLVDSLAKVVRGNIAKRLAQNIRGKGDLLEATDLMIGFLMAQNRIQTHSSLYCDKLEYKQLGKHVEACSTANGLFTKENIDFLIAYTDHSRFDSFHRDVYIPTKPRFRGDTGYIDLKSLSKGESVLFKLPANDQWLQNYRWTLPGEIIVPFVESFEIFLPHNHYKTGPEQEHNTSQVTIKSVAGSAVSTLAPNTSPVYILPKGHSSYVTLYEEGYTSCTSNEIENPYSLCENLPKICDKSSRQAGESLLPTILSTWKLKYQISKGAEILKWDAPTPATNLLIRAKIVIRMLPRKRKRSHLAKPLKRSRSKDEVLSSNGCCDEENRYRSSLNNRKCVVCPDRSTSRLRGLYCEIDEQEPQPGTE